jgi:hypothetical protein
VVPAQVLDPRVQLLVDRQPRFPAIEPVEQLTCRAPNHRPGYPQPQVLQHRDGPVVEQPVVEGAKGQAVGHLVGSPMGVPPDVGGVDADEAIDQAQGEAADIANPRACRAPKARPAEAQPRFLP